MSRIDILLAVLAGLAVLVVFAAGAVVYNKLRSRRLKLLDFEITDFLVNEFENVPEGDDIPLIDRHLTLFLVRYVRLCQSTLLHDDFKIKMVRYLVRRGADRHYMRMLHSPFPLRRSTAAVYLGYMPTDEVCRRLEARLSVEKKYSVKLYIANALCDIGNHDSIGCLVESLIGAPLWYRQKLTPLLFEFGDALYRFIPRIIGAGEAEIQLFIIRYAAEYMADDLKRYLLEKSGSPDLGISRAAVDSLVRAYYHEIDIAPYLESADTEIAKTALWALGNVPTRESVDGIVRLFARDGLHDAAVESLGMIIAREPGHLRFLIDDFAAMTPAAQAGIADTLSPKIEYLLLKLGSDSTGRIASVLKAILLSGNVGGFIEFMNRNKSRPIEDAAVELVRGILYERGDLRQSLAAGLSTHLCARMGIEKAAPPPSSSRRENLRLGLLASMLACAVFMYPAIYFAVLYPRLHGAGAAAVVKDFLFNFNYYFACYSITANGVYIALLGFSYLGAKKQNAFWSIKHLRFLFKRGVLPSVSIIAPAYNEEAGIVESVNSLLNMQYPDYEVIVVNDGSSDATLGRMIHAFALERVDAVASGKIGAMPVRGVYANGSMPNLLIVDKVNGGKADSLNVGINFSSREYFCGIDADSLLEGDSLLKMASQFLDLDSESIAAGGNILPVNGCTVDRGAITKIGVPAAAPARFQMVEYIRSFMGGRVGWAYLRSLLIISGAFGLFKKDRVIEAGGYLTRKGPYEKDTVGEDMELVVRLARSMKERGSPFRICYAFNANCWTEVPETFTVLRRQRMRWHRGLLDIITFHVKMLFNCRYGVIGMVAFPYYFLFEVLGPWIELQGYAVFFLSLALGLLNMEVLLLLFIATIMLGLSITIAAFIIVQKEMNYFSIRDIFILLCYALIENFGVRQYINMMRLSGYTSAFRSTGGWGAMERKGFVQAK